MTITDKTELFVIVNRNLVFIQHGACPDISVQQRLAKKLNEDEKPSTPYYVIGIEVKDLSVRGLPTKSEVTESKHKVDKHDRMVGTGI